MNRYSSLLILLLILGAPFTGCTQQRVDNEFTPVIAMPHFETAKGPRILVDAGHHNFHTLEDKFAPFGKVAGLDGFRVSSLEGRITAAALAQADILVIANALNEQNTSSWQQPVHPAFSSEEVKLIAGWVRDGGRLFLIADHMPFPGAIAELAAAFGFTVYDGFALHTARPKFDVFSYSNGMLSKGALTGDAHPVDSIVSFTGQAFRIPVDAVSVLTLDSNYKLLMPEVAWVFDGDTKTIPAAGLSQLAYARFGSGKVVMAGEAAMFTAQNAGNRKIGLNAGFAPFNLQLLLNILGWLGE